MDMLNKYIGNTPLINFNGIYVKNESLNLSGSIKDRMVLNIITNAEKSGKLSHNKEIIELTTGNTGISLATISAIKGYKFTAMIPKNMTLERIKWIKALGSKIKLISARNDMLYAKKIFEKQKRQNSKAFFPSQFENKDNYLSYYQLADEIINKIKKIDYFIASAGTGGTIIGVGKRLKRFNPKIKIILIEPKEASVISNPKKRNRPHQIFGIGEGFIPKIISENIDVIDDIETIDSKTAIQTTKYLWKKGIFVGISSGANMHIAQKIKTRFPNAIITTIFPDSGDRYLSIMK